MIRAKYIVGTAKELQAKPGGGEKWLASLREKELPEVIEALCTLPGVGPKVAACIALFSLDQNHAIPVDTHVWKVYYISPFVLVLNSNFYICCSIWACHCLLTVKSIIIIIIC
jgi:endonuclease III